jgi:transcriptional regulator with XRE-family HTH domain
VRRNRSPGTYEARTLEKLAIGRRLLLARTSAGMTQEVASRRLGYGAKTQLCQFETGVRFPPMSTLVEMARLYDTSLNWMLGLGCRPDAQAEIVQHMRQRLGAFQERLTTGVAAAIRDLMENQRQEVELQIALAHAVLNFCSSLSAAREQSGEEFDALRAGATVVSRAAAAAQEAGTLLEVIDRLQVLRRSLVPSAAIRGWASPAAGGRVPLPAGDHPGHDRQGAPAAGWDGWSKPETEPRPAGGRGGLLPCQPRRNSSDQPRGDF